MSVFWIANLFAWGIVMIVAAPAAFTAIFRRDHVRRGDPMRLAVFLVAGLFVGQVVRWLWFADDLDLWKALYIVGLFVALYVLRLMFAYGRGDHV